MGYVSASFGSRPLSSKYFLTNLTAALAWSWYVGIMKKLYGLLVKVTV